MHVTNTDDEDLSQNEDECVYCDKRNHSIAKCFHFKKLSVEARGNFLVNTSYDTDVLAPVT